jgi:hydroxymethylpyrimidine pyrophosphatase-like HAD family hydrolase
MTIRVVYSDLDGTMVGPAGCFFRREDGALSLEPARALVDLLAAGLALVLVSGRTRPQLVEAAHVFGADGYVAELGAAVGWNTGGEGWRHELLAGALPTAYAGQLPALVAEESGIVAELCARYTGRLEHHEPWHVGHEADVMLRGLVDVADAEAWLAGSGFGWLRLRDNGVLPPGRPTGLDTAAAPVHVYHLMPAGLSKGLAVAHDLARRGLAPDHAIAIGDSVSDLDMAPCVDRLWLTANGARQPHLAAHLAGQYNVRIATEAVGLGWVQAIRDALGRPDPIPLSPVA